MCTLGVVVCAIVMFCQLVQTMLLIWIACKVCDIEFDTDRLRERSLENRRHLNGHN